MPAIPFCLDRGGSEAFSEIAKKVEVSTFEEDKPEILFQMAGIFLGKVIEVRTIFPINAVF